jgi:hypothetical protein
MKKFAGITAKSSIRSDGSVQRSCFRCRVGGFVAVQAIAGTQQNTVDLPAV